MSEALGDAPVGPPADTRPPPARGGRSVTVRVQLSREDHETLRLLAHRQRAGQTVGQFITASLHNFAKMQADGVRAWRPDELPGGQS